MSAVEFEITTPWGDLARGMTSEEVRRNIWLTFCTARGADFYSARDAYDALAPQERFALWHMLEGMGAKMHRVPVPEASR